MTECQSTVIMWPSGQCNTTPPVIKQINPCKWTDATVPIVQNRSKIYEEAICDAANIAFMTQRQTKLDDYMNHLQDWGQRNCRTEKYQREQWGGSNFANRIFVYDFELKIEKNEMLKRQYLNKLVDQMLSTLSSVSCVTHWLHLGTI